jgi:hypothetical protein
LKENLLEDRWDDVIKMNLKEIHGVDVNLIGSG